MDVQFAPGDHRRAKAPVGAPRGAVTRRENFGAADASVARALHSHHGAEFPEPVAQQHKVPHGLRIPGSASRRAPSNKAFKLTRSIGPSHMEALRATMRRLLGPSQLNAMFDGPHQHLRGATG
jgi:hypothetical protein